MVAGTIIRFKKNGKIINNPSVNSKPIKVLDKNAENVASKPKGTNC